MARQSKEFPTSGPALWLVRVFILPHTCVGVFLMGQLLLTLIWLICGDDMNGRITRTGPSNIKARTITSVIDTRLDRPSTATRQRFQRPHTISFLNRFASPSRCQSRKRSTRFRSDFERSRSGGWRKSRRCHHWVTIQSWNSGRLFSSHCFGMGSSRCFSIRRGCGRIACDDPRALC